MPSNLPYLGASGISAIIAEVSSKQLATTQLERGVLRNVAVKAQRAERNRLLQELNQMHPADLARIGAAASRVERQYNLTDARLALTLLRLNAIEQKRDIAAVRRYITGR
jgi:hypothetical protein